MRATPPRKKKDHKSGPRRFDGIVKDVCGMAGLLGESQKSVRSQVARGLLPYRRLGCRIIFVTSEIESFLKSLPGVTAEQALANVAARWTAETPR